MSAGQNLTASIAGNGRGPNNGARKGVEKLAWDLLSLQALRMSTKRPPFSPDSDWHRNFEQTFPYKETQDQITAYAQVRLRYGVR